MKRFLLFIGLSAALLFSVSWGYNQYQVNNRLRTAIASKPPNGASIIVKQYRDTAGNRHIVYRDVPIAVKQIKAGSAVIPGYVDSLATALKIAANQVNDVTTARITAEGKARLYQTEIDSLKRRVLYFQNKYFEATYTEGSDTLNYQYHLTFNSVGYSKKKGVFGTLTHYHDIYTDDPHATFGQTNRYTVTDYTPGLSIKAQAKATYDFASGHVIPSVGLVVEKGPLEFAGRYYYSYTKQQFQPIVSAAFNFIHIKQ